MKNKTINQVLVETISRTNNTLTGREIQCFKLLSYGMSAKEIARELNISNRTVEVYLVNLKSKLNCRTNLQLMAKLIELCIELSRFSANQKNSYNADTFSMAI